MSNPSLNCPTLIFLIATLRPVDPSRPGPSQALWGIHAEGIAAPTLVYNSIGALTHLPVLNPSKAELSDKTENTGEVTTIVSDEPRWLSQQRPWPLPRFNQ